MEPGRPQEEGRGQEEEWVKDSEVNAEEEREEWAGQQPELAQPGSVSVQNAGQRFLIRCASRAILRNVQPAEHRWCAAETLKIQSEGKGPQWPGTGRRNPQRKMAPMFSGPSLPDGWEDRWGSISYP